ncbi:DNA (cytosine-5)-methyltransferase DRM2-like [Rosa rugosa]|uniref:DNA (cytosine-5)-methyltransferase DRM2-like n=1 Tax=Rosa rugosa TaxID=74645 RepID=UPI002B40E369|nr:DNA (cytosine-5)-methyltransferase DRM2-like [Rosa rugosa]
MRTHLRSEYPEKNKRKLCESSLLKRKRIMGHGNQIIGEDAGAVHLPNPINGFGTPADLCQIQRSLPEAATGPPYFYYENVALTPKGVWSTISRFLYDVKPEFVGSKYFCAAARKRGYIHNLPIKNRIPLVPLLPQTISDAFPMTRRWWSTWDDRTKLNCLQTCIASATITERIMKALKDYNEDEIPPESVRRYVLYECRI